MSKVNLESVKFGSVGDGQPSCIEFRYEGKLYIFDITPEQYTGLFNGKAGALSNNLIVELCEALLAGMNTENERQRRLQGLTIDALDSVLPALRQFFAIENRIASATNDEEALHDLRIVDRLAFTLLANLRREINDQDSRFVGALRFCTAMEERKK